MFFLWLSSMPDPVSHPLPLTHFPRNLGEKIRLFSSPNVPSNSGQKYSLQSMLATRKNALLVAMKLLDWVVQHQQSKQVINQSINQTNQSSAASINQSINLNKINQSQQWSINQSINQTKSINLNNDRSINRPIDHQQSINQNQALITVNGSSFLLAMKSACKHRLLKLINQNGLIIKYSINEIGQEGGGAEASYYTFYRINPLCSTIAVATFVPPHPPQKWPWLSYSGNILTLSKLFHHSLRCVKRSSYRHCIAMIVIAIIMGLNAFDF